MEGQRSHLLPICAALASLWVGLCQPASIYHQILIRITPGGWAV